MSKAIKRAMARFPDTFSVDWTAHDEAAIHRDAKVQRPDKHVGGDAIIRRGTVSGGWVSGGLVSGGVVSGGTVSGGTVCGGWVSGGILRGGEVSGGAVTRNLLWIPSGLLPWEVCASSPGVLTIGYQSHAILVWRERLDEICERLKEIGGIHKVDAETRARLVLVLDLAEASPHAFPEPIPDGECGA